MTGDRLHSIRHLSFFVAVAEEVNFRRAALRLNMSQAALSRRIQNFERALGVDLFDRLPRGVRLSLAGQSLLRDSRKLIDEFAIARERALRIAHGQEGSLRIGLNDTAMKSSLVTDAFRLFRTGHPDVELRLVPDVSEAQIEALLDKRLDVAFLYMSKGGRPPGMCGLPILEDRLLLAMPADHRLARHDRILLSDLRDDIFVWPARDSNRNSHDRMISACERGGLSPRIGAYINSIDQTLSIIFAGGGIGWVQESGGLRPREGLIVRHVEDFDVTFSLEIAWLEDGETPLIRALARCVAPENAELDVSDRSIAGTVSIAQSDQTVD